MFLCLFRKITQTLQTSAVCLLSLRVQNQPCIVRSRYNLLAKLMVGVRGLISAGSFLLTYPVHTGLETKNKT